MPLTYNISYGIAFGLISYVFIKIFTGKIKEINAGTWDSVSPEKRRRWAWAPYIVGVGVGWISTARRARRSICGTPIPGISSAGGVTRRRESRIGRLLLSCVGDDVFGSYIRRSCVEAGIDIRYPKARLVHLSLHSGCRRRYAGRHVRHAQQDLPGLPAVAEA